MDNGTSFPDFKLGLNMLTRHLGLSMIGGLAMMVVIAFGAAYFELAHEVYHPTLPLENADRVVGIMYRFSDDIDPMSLREFAALREELESIEEIWAYREVDRNLFVADGQAVVDGRSDRSGPVEVARVTPAAFRIAGARPLLGRTLEPADTRAGAPPVAVIGYDVWQTRLGGNADVIGRTIRLGNASTTVVGVMPEGFAFPENHNLWTPLRVNVLDEQWGENPTVTVFGRLAPGYTRDEAGQELAAFGSRHAGDFPRPDERMRLSIMPYTMAAIEEPMPPGGFLVYPFFAMVMIVVCAAVGALMYARAETRRGEVTAESAQELSPAHVITRLFAEVLVLAVPAAVLGLVAVYFVKPWGTDQIMRLIEQSRPFFWWDRGLATGTVLYATALAVLGAAFAGAVPALRMIRRRVPS